MKISLVTPAQAGVHVRKNWILAFAGMTSPAVIFRRAQRRAQNDSVFMVSVLLGAQQSPEEEVRVGA